MGSFKMPANTEIGNWLEAAGQFHFSVVDMIENPVTKKGDISDSLKVVASVLAGTVPAQEKRTLEAYLNNPNETHKDGGEFCAKVQARLAIALGIMPDAKPGEEVNIDWQRGKGRQFVATVIAEVGQNDGKTRYKIDGAHIYAVDDPAVAHVPKCEKALKLIGKAGAASGKTTKGVSGNGAKQTAATAPVAQPVGAGSAASSTVDLDNL